MSDDAPTPQELALTFLGASLLAANLVLVGLFGGIFFPTPGLVVLVAILSAAGISAFLLARGAGPAMEPLLAAVPPVVAVVGVVQMERAVELEWIAGLVALAVAVLTANLLGLWAFHRTRRSPPGEPNR